MSFRPHLFLSSFFPRLLDIYFFLLDVNSVVASVRSLVLRNRLRGRVQIEFSGNVPVNFRGEIYFPTAHGNSHFLIRTEDFTAGSNPTCFPTRQFRKSQ